MGGYTEIGTGSNRELSLFSPGIKTSPPHPLSGNFGGDICASRQFSLEFILSDLFFFLFFFFWTEEQKTG
jgi:hypothetical protein